MFIITLCATVTVVWPWSAESHREITRIAWRQFKRNRAVKKFLRDQLGSKDDVIESSIWADSAEAETAYPESGGWHFSNTPIRKCSEFRMDRDCGSFNSKACIVTAIADMTLIVVDRSTYSEQKRADALKFLIHLMGDIHQPLHTGFRSDAGGNAIVLSQSPPIDLHSMWDYGLFASSETSPDIAMASIPESRAIAPPNPSSLSRSSLIEYASAIASESTTLFTCDFAYKNEFGLYIESGDTVSREYIVSRRAVAESRIQTAGSRLAELIEIIAEKVVVPTSPRISNREEKKPVSIFRYPFQLPDHVGQWKVRPSSGATASSSAAIIDQQNENSSDDDEMISASSQRPYENRIGSVSVPDMWIVHLDDFTSTYSCARFYINTTYAILNNQEFHVRILNQKKSKPQKYVLFFDIDCFGTLKAGELEEIFSHELKSDVDEYVHGENIRVTEILRQRIAEFDAIAGEVIQHGNDSSIVRSWGTMKTSQGFTRPSIVVNATIEREWEREFVSNMGAAILMEGGGPYFYVFHRDSIINKKIQFRRLSVFPCILKLANDGKITRRLVVDNRIYNGGLTQNIVKLIQLLNQKNLKNPTTIWKTHRSILHEIVAIEQLFHYRGVNRNLHVIAGFQFHSMTSENRDMAFIEYEVKQ